MAKDEIGRLRHENRRLRRENEYLRHRLTSLGGGTKKGGAALHVMEDSLRNDAVARSRTYIGYLILSMRLSRPFRLIDRTAFAVRRLLFASRLWRILRDAVFLLGIGAQAVVSVGIAVGIAAVLLPAAAVFTAAMMLGGAVSHRMWNRRLSEQLADKPCYLVFASEKNPRKGYFADMVRGFSENGIVLIISRSLIRCRFSGISRLAPNVYLIHTSYYFSLAQLAEKLPSQVIRIL